LNPRRNKSLFGLCFLLAVATWLTYWPLGENKFVNVDDPQYLTENPHVNSGLSLAGVVWALGTGHASNWHPLTWVSHMLDCSVFGLNPRGHHLVSLAFHIANAILLFLLLHRMTGAPWRCFFVAALFALHPTHVESVAWGSERKDVLSASFFLLTLWAYREYVIAAGARLATTLESSTPAFRAEAGLGRNTPRAIRWYLVTLFLFVLALMSKPMAVTLPFVLLLLDFWPLRRLQLPSCRDSESNGSPIPQSSPSTVQLSSAPTLPRSHASLFTLVREKLPLFLLSLGAGIVTFLVQKSGGAVSSFSAISLPSRLANCAVSYLRYLGKTVWPVNLSPIYVHPNPWPAMFVITACGVLLALSLLAVARARRQPWFFTGWFWFVGVLVPAIGLVQVGPQAMADRYLYLPSIGLFIMFVWFAAEFLPDGSRVRESEPGERAGESTAQPAYARAAGIRVLIIPVGISALAGCMLCSWFQVQYWREGEVLYRHALDLDPDNYVAGDYLGNALHAKNRDEEALALFSKTVRLQPLFPEGQYNLGTLLLHKGILDDAVRHLEIAVKLSPNDGNAHHNLANAYLQSNRLPEAEKEYLQAIALKPGDPGPQASLGEVLLRQNRLAEAELAFSEAARLEPDRAEAHRNLAVALVRQGKVAEAISHFAEAVRLKPSDPDLRFNLGLALLENHRLREAEEQFLKIIQVKPDDTRAHYRLAIALHEQRRSREAVAQYRQALQFTPDFPEALNELAWILATDPDSDARDGAEAVTLAMNACRLTKDAQPALILTLAAAYAESSRFPEAIAAAEKARQVAETAGQKELVSRSQEALTRFQSRNPIRDPR
jgi:tetratricopeptide (TPR) repeat protein